MLNSLFGSSLSACAKNETELERAQRELREAQAEIARLREALGSNHPWGGWWIEGLLGCGLF